MADTMSRDELAQLIAAKRAEIDAQAVAAYERQQRELADAVMAGQIAQRWVTTETVYRVDPPRRLVGELANCELQELRVRTTTFPDEDPMVEVGGYVHELTRSGRVRKDRHGRHVALPVELAQRIAANGT